MSKVTLEAPFQSFRGKVCKHTQIIFKEMYGNRFTSQICNPYTGGPTENQLAVRRKLAQAVAAAQTALTDPTQRAQYQEAFSKQKRYQTLRGYVIAQEYAKL